MTLNDKITNVQARLDNDPSATTALVTIYLDDAKEDILNRMYPFGIPSTVTDVPAKYERLQCRLALDRFAKRGAEGESIHSENGINRSYYTAQADEWLREVMQIVGV